MSIHIDNHTLNYYVTNARISIAELQQKIPDIDLFLSGEKQPTFTQLAEIAKKINIPTGLLLLKKSIDIKNQRPEFRKLDPTGQHNISENLRDTIIDMQTKQDFLRTEIDYTLDFIGTYTIEQDPIDVANAIRKKLNIPKFFQSELNDIGKVINYLRQRANDIGIFIFANGVVRKNPHRPLDIEEFRGFVLSDNKAPIIFINQKDSKTGQVFTIVHEIVHLFIGNDEIFTIIDTAEFSYDKIEAFVNQITAEILVPTDSLQAFDTTDIEFLARKFCVSEFVIARRLLTTGKISKTAYQQIITTLDKKVKQKHKTNGGNYNNDIKFKTDKSFLGYIAQAIHNQRISHTDAFQIMGVGYKGYQTLLGGSHD